MTSKAHFLDIQPFEQLIILEEASKQGMPLLSAYAMTVLAAFRRRVRKTVSPFTEDTIENHEYYMIRLSLTLDSLNKQLNKHLSASPLSVSDQRILTELMQDLVIGCIDDCPWSDQLQAELEAVL